MAILTMLNTETPYDSAVPFFHLYPKELKINIHTITCTQMFIAGLFIIAKKG